MDHGETSRREPYVNIEHTEDGDNFSIYGTGDFDTGEHSRVFGM